MDRRQTVAKNALVIVGKVNSIAPTLPRLHLDITSTNVDNLQRRSLEVIPNKVCISTTKCFSYVNFENTVWQQILQVAWSPNDPIRNMRRCIIQYLFLIAKTLTSAFCITIGLRNVKLAKFTKYSMIFLSMRCYHYDRTFERRKEVPSRVCKIYCGPFAFA